MPSSSSRKNDQKRERDRDRKVKKSKRPGSGRDGEERRDSLIEAWPHAGGSSQAAKAALGPEKEAFCQLCEMCGHYFQHPVTFHMKMAHPGMKQISVDRGPVLSLDFEANQQWLSSS